MSEGCDHSWMVVGDPYIFDMGEHVEYDLECSKCGEEGYSGDIEG